MSALLQALQRLENRGTPPVRPIDEQPAIPTCVEQTTSSELEATPAVNLIEPVTLPAPEYLDPAAFADALASLRPVSAVIALVSADDRDDFATTVGELADTASQRLGVDVVSLGPGVLDSTAGVERFAELMRIRPAYGFLHVSADFAAARLEGLRATDGVVLVAELDRTPERRVISLRERLARGGIGILGALALSSD